MPTAPLVAGFVLALWAVVLLAFRARLAAAWHEPALRHPVLIVESDDWAPGPESDGLRLRELAAALARHADGRGRAPVMTLGVVLSLPDPRAVAAAPGDELARLALSEPRFAAVREAMLDGAVRGVFALQLHGMEHFWPQALQAAAQCDSTVARWIADSPHVRTESLPPPLQSRWTDASQLPSRPLATAAIERAVRAELDAFGGIFGRLARVVVPPTFVWDARVEAAWFAGGVRVVVTPGRRFTGRDAAGALVGEPANEIWNGRRAISGATYVVRDRYFEPALGHRADDALRALREKTAAGRPTLLETHRFNFVRDPETAADAMRQIEGLLAAATREFPGIRFMSTEELGTALAARSAELVDGDAIRRVHLWLVRIAESARLRKVAWLTGLVVPALALWIATRPRARAPVCARYGSESLPR